MNENEIEAITDELMVLALDGDKEAAQYFADLSLSRRNWERLRSAGSWRDLIREAQRARGWLIAINPPNGL
jgi:hypothetical protein